MLYKECSIYTFKVGRCSPETECVVCDGGGCFQKFALVELKNFTDCKVPISTLQEQNSQKIISSMSSVLGSVSFAELSNMTVLDMRY